MTGLLQILFAVAAAEPSAVVAAAPAAATVAAAGVAAASAASTVAAATTDETESEVAERRSCWMLQGVNTARTLYTVHNWLTSGESIPPSAPIYNLTIGSLAVSHFPPSL